MMKNYIFILTTLFFLNACSSLSTPTSSSFKADHKLTVTELNGKVHKLDKGQSFSSLKPVMLEAPGRVGLFVLPTDQKSKTFDISLKPLSDFGGEHFNEIADKTLTEIMESIYKAQILLGQDQVKESLTVIRELRLKYPRVSYLMLIESSCLVSLGKKNEAIQLLTNFRAINPEHKASEDFLNQLQGVERLPAKESN